MQEKYQNKKEGRSYQGNGEKKNYGERKPYGEKREYGTRRDGGKFEGNRDFKGENKAGYNRGEKRPARDFGGEGKSDFGGRSGYQKRDFGGKSGFDRKPKREYREKDVSAEEPLFESAENVPAENKIGNGAVIGRNAVRELLRSGRTVDKLLVQSGEREGALIPLVGEAIAKGIPVVETERRKLDQISGFLPHQGIVALAAEKDYCEIEDILKIAEERGEKPLIVIADGIADPYNLGAVIRCAEGCGAHGLIIPKRHAAGLSPVVTKASAGAIEHLAIAKVSNIAAAVDTLQKAGVWVFAAEAGGADFRKTDMSTGTAIVLGSEGDGVSELVRKKSDGVISIPMYGKVNSFNVSTAAAVLLCEAARQQRRK